jgi:hypothetical protein
MTNTTKAETMSKYSEESWISGDPDLKNWLIETRLDVPTPSIVSPTVKPRWVRSTSISEATAREEFERICAISPSRLRLIQHHPTDHALERVIGVRIDHEHELNLNYMGGKNGYLLDLSARLLRQIIDPTWESQRVWSIRYRSAIAQMNERVNTSRRAVAQAHKRAQQAWLIWSMTDPDHGALRLTKGYSGVSMEARASLANFESLSISFRITANIEAMGWRKVRIHGWMAWMETAIITCEDHTPMEPNGSGAEWEQSEAIWGAAARNKLIELIYAA